MTVQAEFRLPLLYCYDGLSNDSSHGLPFIVFLNLLARKSLEAFTNERHAMHTFFQVERARGPVGLDVFGA